MPLNTRITSTLTADLTPSANTTSGSTTHTASSSYTLTLTTGTATGQADKEWSAAGRSIAASSTDSLDLAGSALTDAFGASVTFVKLKVIRVQAAATNTNNVNVTRPATNGVPWALAAGDGIPVGPGGYFEWVFPGAGITVTAATGDLIDIVNSGAGSAVVYDIVLIGTSA